MAVSTRKTIGGTAPKGRRRRFSQRSTSARSQSKTSRMPRQVKYRGAKISGARVRDLRDDLDRTRATVGDLHENFWVMSERDIREMLAKTQKKIARAVVVLEEAA